MSRNEKAVVAAIDRAARVLSAFTDSWDFLSLPEIAKRAKLTKPTAFRILATLAEKKLVHQNEENNTYGLGFLTLKFADVVRSSRPVREAARPAMHMIRDAVNETVTLSILHEGFSYDIDNLEGANTIVQSQLLGIPTPLYASAAGCVFLAAMPDGELTSYLGRPGRPAAMATKHGLERTVREIALIRKNGYGVRSGDFMLGGHTVAAPVAGSQTAAAGVLYVSFPQARFSKELEQRCVRALVNGAHLASRRLAESDCLLKS